MQRIALTSDAIGSQTAPATPSKGRSTTELAHSAQAFESVLLGQWLQAAEQSFGSVPGADESQDASDEQMKSYGIQAVSTAITAKGGIGLARTILPALERASASERHRS